MHALDIEEQLQAPAAASRHWHRAFGLGVVTGLLICTGLAAVASSSFFSPTYAESHDRKMAHAFLAPLGQLPGRGPSSNGGSWLARGGKIVAGDYANSKEMPIAIHETPSKLRGSRETGMHPGSVRVRFTLPDKSSEPKTIELVRSKETDNPSMGAVKVSMPVGAKVISKDSRTVVKRVEAGSGAAIAGILAGDIIRAMSVPVRDKSEGDAPWWKSIGRTQLPDAEDGLLILDGKSADIYDAALEENIRTNGANGEIVLIVERPIQRDPDDDSNLQGLGRKFREWLEPLAPQLDPKLAPQLVPIPIPVEDRDPRLPPNLPPSTGYPPIH